MLGTKAPPHIRGPIDRNPACRNLAARRLEAIPRIRRLSLPRQTTSFWLNSVLSYPNLKYKAFIDGIGRRIKRLLDYPKNTLSKFLTVKAWKCIFISSWTISAAWEKQGYFVTKNR